MFPTGGMIPGMSQQHPLPQVVIEAARNERQRIVAAREAAMKDAAAPFDEKLKELDTFLAPFEINEAIFQATKIFVDLENELSISGKIKETAKAMIQPGTHVTTEEIYRVMVEKGVVFPDGKPPLARITRVVSGTGLYRGHKTKGWSLKGEEPVGAGSSSATTSVADIFK